MRTVDGPRSGKRGKVVASRNRFGQYERALGAQQEGGTPARWRVWQNMSDFSRLWNRLTEEQRTGWRRLAEQHHSRHRLGQSGKLDGQKLFTKLNLVLATCGREPLLDAIPCGQFTPNPVAAIRISTIDDRFELKLKVHGTPAEDIMVFASPPCNAGRAYCSIFSFIGLLPPAVGAECDMRKQYLRKLKQWRVLTDKRFHVPLEGARVFFRAVQQVNGWENELGTFQGSALVSANT
ncbi:MAG: hypothetical protein NT154_44020 [Verrucomicrobia bacterium]|nr:hypothetical protein [Verrucomicrobiota bacterium]